MPSRALYHICLRFPIKTSYFSSVNLVFRLPCRALGLFWLQCLAGWWWFWLRQWVFQAALGVEINRVVYTTVWEK